MNAVFSCALPVIPYPEFPLRAHRNGQWYKSVWNPRTKKSEQCYFGLWKDDPKGDRALHDPVSGWLARRPHIKAGVDNVAITPVSGAMTLGDLMALFLKDRVVQVEKKELSSTTLGDYLKELPAFVSFMKASSPPQGLRPEHFAAYMEQLVKKRRLGRHSRRRVRAYIMAMLRFGAGNNWYQMPATGTAWISPNTSPDAIRQAKARAGIKDHSERIFSGDEIDKLLAAASPTFKAAILIAVNAGLGPADVARLRWDMIDMATGRLTFPRFKTGTLRKGYLWKKTRRALRRLRTLKQNRLAIERDGQSALVFVTRTGLPFYREEPIHANVEINGKKTKKLIGIKICKPLLCTFGRLTRNLKMEGAGFYRLRHTLKTLSKKARDPEALNLMMGHVDRSSGQVYDHEQISWNRIRRVARFAYRGLWPKVKHSEGMRQHRMSIPNAVVGRKRTAVA
jgi:integrase